MTAYDFKVRKRRGEVLDLKTLEGKVLLVVNTATGCGFTPQYEGLEKLYRAYHEAGLEILDFPCNQFADQAPGSDEEIHEFCTLRYNTTFDQLAKATVNGEDEEPLFTFLKREAPEEKTGGFGSKMTMKAISKLSSSTKNPGDIRWNFTKFLVGRDGKVAGRYAPTFKPEDLEKEIKELL
ncbi:MAG: glutathione peroxidase [Clostridia bacterium]|nr:glutathione peroxidase [Clostridia bacterium]